MQSAAIRLNNIKYDSSSFLYYTLFFCFICLHMVHGEDWSFGGFNRTACLWDIF